MDDPVRKAVDVSIGAAVTAKEYLDKLAADMEQRGRTARAHGAPHVADANAKAKAHHESLTKLADDELHRFLVKARIATAKDVARIEERLTRIEARLSALEAEPPGES